MPSIDRVHREHLAPRTASYAYHERRRSPSKCITTTLSSRAQPRDLRLLFGFVHGERKGARAHFSPRGPRRQVFVAGVEVRGGESKACPERSRMGTCFCFPFLLLGRERDPLVRTGDGSTIASRTPRPEVPVPEQLQAAEIAVNRRQAPPILQILVCAKLELACFYLFVRQRLEIGFGLRASSFLPQGRALTTVIFSATHNVCAQSSSPRCALV